MHSPTQTDLGTGVVSDSDVADAYLYLLGRALVLRQQRLDFEQEGFRWNQLVYREPGGVSWANPNLDVAYSEAWVAVDERNGVLLEMPTVEGGRYYTWHMLNGWGETIVNINERTFPRHPHGTFALCLAGSHPPLPARALRVDLPCRTSRVLARIELGGDAAEAVRLQRACTLMPLGPITIAKPVQVPLFSNAKLPGVELFDRATEILASEADINAGVDEVRGKLVAVEALARAGAENRARIGEAIERHAWSTLKALLAVPGPKEHGWSRPSAFGNYGSDYRMRTAINLGGIWANNGGEATYFVNVGLEGGRTCTQTFPAGSLPASKAAYFWSVIAVDGVRYKVIPNGLNRFLLNDQSPLVAGADGSLTLTYGPTPPADTPRANWLPTPAAGRYNLTFRLYGPTDDVSSGAYFPPPLVERQV